MNELQSPIPDMDYKINPFFEEFLKKDWEELREEFDDDEDIADALSMFNWMSKDGKTITLKQAEEFLKIFDGWTGNAESFIEFLLDHNVIG